MNEKTIFIFEAEDGMVLSRDVYTSDGQLIATTGTVLDTDTILKISGYHIIEVFIFTEGEDISGIYTEIIENPNDLQPIVPESSSYLDKIRASKDFKEFEKVFNNTIEDFKENMTDFINGKSSEINVSDLMEGPLELFNNSRSNLHIFDMLHSMRSLNDASFVHSLNVALISSVIGKWVGYDDLQINILMLAGLLHDIGKTLIPEDILTKPGRLSLSEFSIMKTHTLLGYRKLADESLPTEVKETCLLHHERADGSGYPFGLKLDKIPEYTQIVSIADVYDAMTADRVYRGALCPFDVLAVIERDAYSKYNPDFAFTFLKNVSASYLHNNVLLSDGREGEIVLINNNAISRPIVQCDNEFIDLSKNHDITIISII